MVASPRRPPRDPRLAPLAAASQPPSSHSSSLDPTQWLSAAAALWRASRRSLPDSLPAAVRLSFFLHTHAATLTGVIALPPEQLAWFAAPGDCVLLSSGASHHATVFLSIDPGTQSVTLQHDPAHPLPAAEFQRQLIAVHTLDTPALLERFLDAHPTERANHRLLLQFGDALLDGERDSLAPFAAAWFDQSLFAALLATNDEREQIAAQLYYALTLAMHRARPQPEALAAKPFADRLYRLMLDHTEAALQRRLTAAHLIRMAAAAATAQDFLRAHQLFTLVLHREPGHPGALQQRASAYFHKRRFEEAIEDALQALESATGTYAEALGERPRLSSAPAPLPDLAASRFTDAALQLSSIYGVLTASCIGAARWYEAKRHALAWQSLNLHEAAPLAILARVEEQSGNRAAARALYLQAAAAEPDATRKFNFESLADQLAANGDPA
ncbi:MAG: hypothetical protein IPJ98_15845 [Bryobacterales bacterium]|nr:hypothetical protein [Bryobacterales bacterium]